MPPSVEALEESAYDALLAPIWGYLALTHDPVPSDVIFVFGSRDLGVARRAGELYAAGDGSRGGTPGGGAAIGDLTPWYTDHQQAAEEGSSRSCSLWEQC